MRALLTLLLFALPVFGQMGISMPSPTIPVGSAPASHPKQKFVSTVLTGTLSNRFFAVAGFYNTASFTQGQLAPTGLAGNFRKLCARFVSDPDSGASSKGYTITLYKGASSTSTAVTILSSTASFENCYTSADVHFAATDPVGYKITTVSTPANTPQLSTIIEFEPDVDDGTTVLPADSNSAISATDAVYIGLTGSVGTNSTENTRAIVAPMAGTITGFQFNLATVPGGTGTRTYTLRCAGTCGGSPGDQGTAITYTAAQNGIMSQSESISVSQGDRLDIRQNTTNTPATSLAGWTVLFKPTTTGQFILPAFNLSLSNSTNSYAEINAGAATASTTEALAQQILYSDMTLQGWTACSGAAPGGGKTFTLSLQDNGSPASVTYSTQLTNTSYCPVTSVNTTFTPTNFDYYDTLSVESGAPSGTPESISYIGYIAP